ncbi:MAG: hypothetical protein NVSMB14_04540 [Isosphaeraceae bacterium]
MICLGPEGELASVLRKERIDVDCLDVDRRDPPRAIARLAAAFKARQIRLVQSFLFHADIAARLAAPIAGVAWVVGGIRVAEKEKKWHLWISRWTQRLSSGSVCVSRGVERYARDVGKIEADRLTVIPNGIDPGPIDRAERCSRGSIGVPEEAFLALFVGRLERQKGLPVLFEAAERVVCERADWYLAIVGDGREASELRRLCETRPAVAHRVRWLGKRDDVPSLLKTADLLVLPSLWEGMPNVVLEALAARRAVVATDVEGSEDLVEPEQTGWLVPAGDAGALAVALLDAAEDRRRLAQFGDRGRLKIETEYSLKRVIDQYEFLWAGLLGFERPI